MNDLPDGAATYDTPHRLKRDALAIAAELRQMGYRVTVRNTMQGARARKGWADRPWQVYILPDIPTHRST